MYSQWLPLPHSKPVEDWGLQGNGAVGNWWRVSAAPSPEQQTEITGKRLEVWDAVTGICNVFTSNSRILNSSSSFWSLASWMSFFSRSSSPSICLTCKPSVVTCDIKSILSQIPNIPNASCSFWFRRICVYIYWDVTIDKCDSPSPPVPDSSDTTPASPPPTSGPETQTERPHCQCCDRVICFQTCSLFSSHVFGCVPQRTIGFAVICSDIYWKLSIQDCIPLIMTLSLFIPCLAFILVCLFFF